jgi:hypothetical protein
MLICQIRPAGSEVNCSVCGQATYKIDIMAPRYKKSEIKKGQFNGKCQTHQHD